MISTNDSFTGSAFRAVRRGFTLTELLLVIIIVAILAAMTMTVQRSAVETTRRERTAAPIRKIDAALTSAYEKYQYRKPDVGSYIDQIENALIESYARSGTDFKGLPQTEQKRIVYNWVLDRIRRTWIEWCETRFIYSDEDAPSIDNQFAPYILRTITLRELLLLDFPDCFDEVEYEPRMNDSPVHLTYQRYLETLRQTAETAPDGDISADLLYLIVMNTSPETRGTFLERETADTNGNGIPEFVDGWGNPIRFIRWAPALPESNRQPTLAEGQRISRYRQLKRLDAAGYELETANAGDYADEYYYSEAYDDYPQSDYDFYTYFEEYYPGLLDMSGDPFDPMASMNGWLLTPLIYSAGPDREYGLEISQWFCSPFEDAVTAQVGLGTELSDDNITNHNLE